jgi:hypothetical protein
MSDQETQEVRQSLPAETLQVLQTINANVKRIADAMETVLTSLPTFTEALGPFLSQLAATLGNIESNTASEAELLEEIFDALVSENTGAGQAVTGIISVGPNQQGDNMPLTVDSTGQNLQFQFEDDHGDIATPPAGDGSGIVVAFASDNASVGTVGSTVVGTDANGNALYTAPLSFGVDGSFNASAVVSNTSGAALVDDDGVTAFVQPASINIPVAAGQAVTGDITEN